MQWIRALPEILLIPLLFAVLAGSLVVAAFAALADLATWIGRARRGSPPGFTELFRGWPLLVWGASAALLPDLLVRLAAGLMFAEHAALLLRLKAPVGQIVAGGTELRAE